MFLIKAVDQQPKRRGHENYDKKSKLIKTGHVYQNYNYKDIRKSRICSARLEAISCPRVEGVPTNNKRGRGSGCCLLLEYDSITIILLRIHSLFICIKIPCKHWSPVHFSLHPLRHDPDWRWHDPCPPQFLGQVAEQFRP